MKDIGVISPVEEPTDWFSPIVVAPKKSGDVRICVDLTQRVKQHPLPSVYQTLGHLAGAKIFSKIDANSGFYQIPLTQSSRLLTTFYHTGWTLLL